MLRSRLHLVTAVIFAVVFGAAGFLAQGRSVSAIIPVVWSAAAVFTPLALLIALYARIAHLDRSIPFAILAVMLAAAYGAATEILNRRDSRPGLPISIALFATGTLGALALALTFALEKGWLTIALALMSMGTAWISMQRPIPFLRSLAAILAGIVVLRIGYEPRIVGDAVGTTPIFNWLLWGYGIPALSFWIGKLLPAPPRRRCAAARRGSGGDPVHRTAGVHGNSPCRQRRRHVPRSHLARRSSRCRSASRWPWRSAWSDCAFARGSIVHNVGAVLLTAVCRTCHACSGCCCWRTPMILADQCRRRLHQPSAARLRPAGGAGAAAVLCGGGPAAASYANTIAAGALILALTYVTLEIRRLYHGPMLTRGETTGAEQYTYSIAWLAFGVALLGIGIVFNSQRARLASAAVIALTILKAFLIDMSTLTGVYRALSFMCLGLVLVAIGWLYQRILFRRQTPPAMPAVQPGE